MASLQIIAPEVSQGVLEAGEVQPSPTIPANDDTPQRASNVKESWKDKVMRVLTVFIMKFFLGAFDIGSDILSAANFITGQFGLALYFLADLDAPYNEELYGAHLYWGVITLVVIWVPGTFIVVSMGAQQRWRGIGWGQGIKRITGYIFLIITWPVFSLLL